MNLRRLHLAALGVVPLLAGCGAHLLTAPTQPSEDPGFIEEAVAAPAGMEPTRPGPFRLQPGDVVTLRTISPAPLEALHLGVDEAGLLHAPLMGSVPVAGASLEEAEDRLGEKLRRYDRFGLVSLEVEEPAGHGVNVLGTVERPGRYVLRGGMRVADLVGLAGGLDSMKGESERVERADADAARLLRGGEPLPISLPRALEGHPRHNVLIAPGDVLWIPSLEGAAVRVLGEVKTARTVPWRPGLRLSEALARAGGLTAEADAGDVRVVRGPLSKPRIYQARFAELLQGKATDVELARGDIVFVTKHWFATATDVLQRLTPLLAAGAAAGTAAALIERTVSTVPK